MDRPKQTIHAAEIFHDNARNIASVCSDIPADHVALAVVDRDMAFAGVWVVPLSNLTVEVPRLAGDGWSIVVSPGTDTADIEDRALRLARLAFRRWEAMRRWVSKQR